ncbi:MAG: peptidoglycan DD-metalloendopeptidase family protein [Alphaproteobacteria bacterium]|nr:peptidoglycan DD-metalloendopeptidase family protein [Alphaproteobacteria bacterium]
MRPSKLFFRLPAIVAAVWLLASPASATDSPDNLVPELDQARRDAIQAARETQQHQAAAAALDRELDLLDRDLAARRRGLDESQPEQAQLLGALERLALHPPDETKASEAPLLSSLDRARSQMLLAATVPALRAEAQALAGEIQAVALLRARIAAKESELAGLRDALPKYREHLAQIVAHRAELIRQLLPEPGKATDLAKPDRADLDNLIQLADAAADKRDKALLARARAGLPKEKAEALTLATADPTRPKDLRPFAAADVAMLLPAAGTVLARDQTGGAEAAGQGLHLGTASGAVVVAPFDGQVVYAGPFQPYVLVLIIRHTDGYHSVLAGLGRADSAVGQWVLAGEPVGVMPDAAGQGSGGEIYVELRRNGQPVDPQPWLAKRDESTGRGDRTGD